MLEIELVPDLTHCIETVTKREYEDTLRCLLAAREGDQELGKRLELLRIQSNQRPRWLFADKTD
jgi:hypothetical protein